MFVPLDNRSVTCTSRSCSAKSPVAALWHAETLLGNNLQSGEPDAIIAWLNSRAPRTNTFVLSSDMLAYGGTDCIARARPKLCRCVRTTREIDHLRARHDRAWIGVFGTVMRLAPTGVPAGTPFFAPYPIWSYLQQYANLHDPLQPDELEEAQRLRGLIGDDVLNAYLQTRARNYGVDRLLLDKARARSIDRLVLGQDDAKPFGLHVPKCRHCKDISMQTIWRIGFRSSQVRTNLAWRSLRTR